METTSLILRRSECGSLKMKLPLRRFPFVHPGAAQELDRHRHCLQLRAARGHHVRLVQLLHAYSLCQLGSIRDPTQPRLLGPALLAGAAQRALLHGGIQNVLLRVCAHLSLFGPKFHSLGPSPLRIAVRVPELLYPASPFYPQLAIVHLDSKTHTRLPHDASTHNPGRWATASLQALRSQ